MLKGQSIEDGQRKKEMKVERTNCLRKDKEKGNAKTNKKVDGSRKDNRLRTDKEKREESRKNELIEKGQR
jgi:hypothetical protein